MTHLRIHACIIQSYIDIPTKAGAKERNVMTGTTHLMVVDGQNDFIEGGSLQVPGGRAAMQATGELVRTKGRMFDVVHGTLDAHQRIHIAQPTFWEDSQGNSPAFFTIITAKDVKDGVWRPRYGNSRPRALGGKTLTEHAYEYISSLEANGKCHTIWPVHCEIGTNGGAVQADLAEAIGYWAEKHFVTVNWVTKGSNPFVEHFGGMHAEMLLHSDPGTGLNGEFLKALHQAGRIYFVGLALNFCLRRTMEQIIDNVDPELVRKFVLLLDCTAAIPGIPGDDTQDWLQSIQARGVALTNSTNV